MPRSYDRTANGLSSHFAWNNRSKESLTLNIKTPRAKQILARLLAGADVFIQNLAPGAVTRLGFDNERLRADYPRLIVCHISGYGSTGPYRDKKAYDALIQAEAGLFSITGSDETPAKAGIAVADIAAGMYAYSGILTALLMRAQSGQGTVLEVSLFEALAEWMGYPMYFTMGGTPPPRTGTSHATIAPYGIFETQGGHSIMLSIQNAREWLRFCAIVLDDADLAQDARFATNSARILNRPALQAAIEEVFLRLTLDEVTARLDAAQIAYAQARTMGEFMEHPQLRARDRWRTMDSALGPIPTLIPPVSCADLDVEMRPIPTVGQHTDSILHELGYDAEAIRALRADEVV